MNTAYNNYGFSEENSGVIHGKTDGIEDKTIGSLYTVQEEYRDWRNTVLQHITNEADRTIKTVDEHTTEEVDDAETKILKRVDTAETNIKNDISGLNKYVVNTVKPAIDSVSTKVDNVQSDVTNVKSTLASHTSALETITNLLRNK